MLSKKMESALNDQINAEQFSSHLYLALAAYYHSLNLTGFSHWMRVQAQEEMGHSLKIYEYIQTRRSRVTLRQIEAPPADWKSPTAAFEAAYEHERKITATVDSLMGHAITEKDHATHEFLEWFVKEQVEEEAATDEVVQKLRMIKDDPAALFLIDRELAQRKE